MNKIDIEEASDTELKKAPKDGFFKKNKKLVTIFGIILFVALIVGCALAIVLPQSFEKNHDSENSRIDCLPWAKNNPSYNIENLCKKSSYCRYQNLDGNKAMPSCYIDKSKLKIKFKSRSITDLGESFLVESEGGKQLKIDFEFLDDNTLRFKIFRPDVNDYEVPIQLNKPASKIKAKNPRYEIEIDQNDNFNFRVKRSNTKTVVWDTSLGPIIFDNMNRVISTKLPSKNVYGFGENRHESFKHNLNYQNWPVFNRDEAPENKEYANLYGTQPFYTCMENDGQSHGVMLYNSNAFDYEFIPEPGLVYRVTGGVLDFYIFFGPDPESVIQQFTQYVGRTFFPPYWALGFQVSRYGYKDLEDMRSVLDRFKFYNIPLDTQVADIDHFDKRKDFSIDPINWKDLPSYFDYLHEIGMKTVLLLDPFIMVNDTEAYWPFTTARNQDIFIKWPKDYPNPDFADTNSSTMLGYCWPPGKVAYPDYMKKKTQNWWIESIKRHHNTLKFDGLWIDMNDPAVFGTNEEKPFNWPVNDKPYWSLKCPDNEQELVKTKASYLWKKDNKLSDKTLCMNGRLGENDEYSHFDTHNIFGYFETIPTFEAAQIIDKSRGFVITRSTFLGSGKFGGHWTGDNSSLWRHLLYSIIGMLEFNLFGIPYVGADICGFWLNTTVEMCARWSSLGAFYPFSRNHNNDEASPQDPGFLGPVVAESARNALRIRYEILPYYYTLFYKSHLFGTTVARPLFHEYPKDSITYSIDRQFLIGPAFLVTPVLDEGKKNVTGYFPSDNWYDFSTGEQVAYKKEGSIKGEWLTFMSNLTQISTHVRGGYIIPTQQVENTTFYSRQKPFGLIVAPNEFGEAFGELFNDDGSSELNKDQYYHATFQLRENVLKMNVEHDTYSNIQQKTINKIRIYAKIPLNQVLNVKFVLNKNTLLDNTNSKLIFEENQIIITNLSIPMNLGFQVEWFTNGFNPIGVEYPVIDCSIQNPDITNTKCIEKECDWKASTDSSPSCVINPSKGGYKKFNESANKLEVFLQKKDKFVIYPEEISTLKLKITHATISKTNRRMTRIKISDPSNPSRYEVPFKILQYEDSCPGDAPCTNPFLNVDVGSDYLSVSNKNNELLFDTKNVGHGFLYTNQFLQIVMNLGYKNLYGFGENTHHSFRHSFSYSNWWGIFGRDQGTGGKYINLYGSQPFFMAVNENTGRAFGVLILNSNAQEYGLLPPNSISYRTIGGILDFYIMEEETPEILMQSYHLLIGTTYFPPYWALGFQLCKYGYNSLANLKGAVDRTLDAKIPLDVQYGDIDYMRKQLDFTYDQVNFKGLPEFIEDIRKKGVRFIIILDPAINSEENNYLPFENGLKDEIYIKWPKDQNPQLNETHFSKPDPNPYLLGYVWPEGKTVFPDFFKNKTKTWWKKEIKNQYDNMLKFDGLWIDMNEPANFDTNKDKPFNWPNSRPPWNLTCPNNTYDDPPYLPIVATMFGNTTRLSDKTICMRAVQGENDEYIHYDVHNLYGFSQSKPTLDAVRSATNKRSIVISRSNFPSSGTHVGHWLGDNTSKWEHLKLNIIGLLEYNLFGYSYIGADTCGFFGDTTPEMCTRWMQLGAFNTYFRNHNGLDGIDQDPAALGLEVAAASKKVVETRYTLLPFLYTLFYNANKNGGTVVRSLMHEFSTDDRTFDNDRQFMWGSSLLISPVLEENKRSVFAYFPKARWFDYYSGAEIMETQRIHELFAPLDHIPLHIKGGSILVTQEPAMNTELSRQNPFGLIIAPSEINKTIEFSLYYDDGEVIDPTKKATIINFNYKFNGSSHVIESKIIENNYIFGQKNTLNTIRIFGVKVRPTTFALNSNILNVASEYNNETKELIVSNLGLQLLDPFTITAK